MKNNDPIIHNVKLSLRSARFLQWSKNIFMIPGFVLALTLENNVSYGHFYLFGIAVVASGCIASANYTLNEYLDRKQDSVHPAKKSRPMAKGIHLKPYVIIQYIVFSSIGLLLSLYLQPMFLITNLIFLLMGLIYNVPPLRAKEIPYVDVIVESFNNPIRLMLGWSVICSIIIPPLSILISYWFGGAFLMSMKRFAEYKFLGNKLLASKYRKSFEYYNETNLMLSSFFYALICVFFLAIFTIKYFIQLIIVFPLISLLFVWYTSYCLKIKTNVSRNINIYKNKFFIIYCFIIALLIFLLLFLKIDLLNFLVDHSYITDIKIEWKNN